jgi:hypothetical protein
MATVSVRVKRGYILGYISLKITLIWEFAGIEEKYKHKNIRRVF